ncbi:uncharacterized protein LOC120669400 [Panicum virgatum]|nr:uncharacterized protein LOC120669400 [Panicum virgatum]
MEGDEEWLDDQPDNINPEDFVVLPSGKQRAVWNKELEKSLVEILHDYKDSGCRGDNGWNSEGWNRMVKEFHTRNRYISFSKSQIQEKEGQLKRDYKMLKAARQQSGSSWNEKRCMVEGSSAMWDNLEQSFPKIKRFRNNKASFPLYEALGELYDGHLIEGKYNCTTIDSMEDEAPLNLLPELDDDDDVVLLDEQRYSREEEIEDPDVSEVQRNLREQGDIVDKETQAD